MLDPVVQGALVTLLTALLVALTRDVGLEIEEPVLYAIAGSIVVWLLSRFGLLWVRKANPTAVKRGLLGEE
jgi:hypothetical protein